MPQPEQDTYQLTWPEEFTQLEREMSMIRADGYVEFNGVKYGKGLFHHYRNLISCLWPDEDHHRWTDMVLKEFLDNRITIVQGPKDTGKTHTWARIAMADYWTFPTETLWLISSTDIRGLELRVWGDLKDLFNRAKDIYPDLSGHPLDSKHGIFTDKLDETDRARDIRRGLICIPCIGGSGEWVGIEKYCGIKSSRRRLIGDELQFMKTPYLLSVEHMDKGNFKMGGSGNPIGQGDPLDRMAEPVGGWGTEPKTEKTDVWKNKWGGITINFDGRDSPNNDDPNKKYPYLINPDDIARTAGRHGTDSSVYWTQVIGKRKVGLNENRVLTREMCIRFGAFEPVIWAGTQRTPIYAQDSAFGGDRAIEGHIEFGLTVKGQLVLEVHPPRIIPIKVPKTEGQGPTPEEQLANAMKNYCNANDTPASNAFFDAGMRATLATEVSRVFSNEATPINFGGTATTRPVSFDEYVWDDKLRTKRLKRCDEQYSKFVTELWGSVRLVVICGQMRGLPEEVAQEFFVREWKRVKGDRWELETKEDMKLRVGFSPDYADWLAIAIEGARRKGFQIAKLANDSEDSDQREWLRDLKNKQKDLRQKHSLTYA